jgi:hypothetical protein
MLWVFEELLRAELFALIRLHTTHLGGSNRRIQFITEARFRMLAEELLGELRDEPLKERCREFALRYHRVFSRTL